MLVSLQDVFNSVGYKSRPATKSPAQDENILTFERASEMVKRFAADDAVVYQILHGQRPCSYMQKRLTTLGAQGHFDYFKSASPKSTAMPVNVAIQHNVTMRVERGSGYENMVYLIYLIHLALKCRAGLMPSFPMMTESTKGDVENLAQRLDPEKMARFPISEDEAEAIKNMALPSNPCHQSFQKAQDLRKVYFEEFERLKNGRPAPPPPPPPPPTRMRLM